MSFRAALDSGLTVSRQESGLSGIQYCARFQRDSGNTSTQQIILSHALETSESISLAGKVINFSFYARAGADLSNTTIGYALRSGTGIDESTQNIGSWTGVTDLGTFDKTLTTNWQRFTTTAFVPSNATQIAFNIVLNPTGTAGANDYFEITGVQLEVGSVATPFKRNAPSIQAELAACQRYYYQIGPGFSAFTSLVGGFYEAAGVFNAIVPFPVTMRAMPSSVLFSSITTYDGSSGISVTNVVLASQTQYAGGINASVSGATQFRPGFLALAGTSSFLAFSAEL
jgi:hypothetical protein